MLDGLVRGGDMQYAENLYGSAGQQEVVYNAEDDNYKQVCNINRDAYIKTPILYQVAAQIDIVRSLEDVSANFMQEVNDIIFTLTTNNIIIEDKNDLDKYLVSNVIDFHDKEENGYNFEEAKDIVFNLYNAYNLWMENGNQQLRQCKDGNLFYELWLATLAEYVANKDFQEQFVELQVDERKQKLPHFVKVVNGCHISDRIYASGETMAQINDAIYILIKAGIEEILDHKMLNTLIKQFSIELGSDVYVEVSTINMFNHVKNNNLGNTWIPTFSVIKQINADEGVLYNDHDAVRNGLNMFEAAEGGNSRFKVDGENIDDEEHQSSSVRYNIDRSSVYSAQIEQSSHEQPVIEQRNIEQLTRGLVGLIRDKNVGIEIFYKAFNNCLKASGVEEDKLNNTQLQNVLQCTINNIFARYINGEEGIIAKGHRCIYLLIACVQAVVQKLRGNARDVTLSECIDERYNMLVVEKMQSEGMRTINAKNWGDVVHTVPNLSEPCVS